MQTVQDQKKGLPNVFMHIFSRFTKLLPSFLITHFNVCFNLKLSLRYKTVLVVKKQVKDTLKLI